MPRRSGSRIALSVDWDYFVVNPEGSGQENLMLYDWGHTEKWDYMVNAVWVQRASVLLNAGEELLETSGEEVHFWERFKLAPSVRVIVAESHFAAFDALAGFDAVVSYDAHHDFGYDPRFGERLLGLDLNQEVKIDCGSWALGLALTEGTHIDVRYPGWKHWAFDEVVNDDTAGWLRVLCKRKWSLCGDEPRETIDTVFICRSGAWSPAWLDDDFDAFLSRLPAGAQIEYPNGPVEKRAWSLEAVEEFSLAMKAINEEYREGVAFVSAGT